MGFHSMSKRMFSASVLPSTQLDTDMVTNSPDTVLVFRPSPDGMSSGRETSAIACGSIRSD